MSRNRKRLNVLFCFLTVLCLSLLSGCSSDEVYSEFYSFPESVWEKYEVATFEVPAPDERNASHEVVLDIRNNNDYPFQNLWLFIDLLSPKGDLLRRDTVNIELADVYGKWHGKGINLYTYSYLYEKNQQYPDTGVYIYSIQQGMREKNLKGISDIGLKILEKTH